MEPTTETPESTQQFVRELIVTASVLVSILISPVLLWFSFLFMFAIPGFSYYEKLDVPQAGENVYAISSNDLNVRSWYGGTSSEEQVNHFFYRSNYGSPFRGIVLVESNYDLVSYDHAVFSIATELTGEKAYTSLSRNLCVKQVSTKPHCLVFRFEGLNFIEGLNSVEITFDSAAEELVDATNFELYISVDKGLAVRFWQGLMGV